jgi:hypothetical protein
MTNERALKRKRVIEQKKLYETSDKLSTLRELLGDITLEVKGKCCNMFVFKLDTSSDTEQVAISLFTSDQNIVSCKTFENYILVDVKKSECVSTYKNKHSSPGTTITSVGRKRVKFIDPTLWQYLQKRVISVEEPALILHHVNVFINGRWYQYPVVNHVLTKMFSTMGASSRERGHTFDPVIAKAKLIEAFERVSTDMKCACGHPRCTSILSMYGTDAFSPDRKNDDAGYSDDKQVLTMVCKAHNTRIRHDSVPKPMKYGRKWSITIARHMVKSTAWRINKLRDKAENMTALDRRQVAQFDEECHKGFDRLVQLTMLLEKKQSTCDRCFLCDRGLYFGDAESKLQMSHVGNQASPDRVDNTNVFYDEDNFNLVCVSCNLNESTSIRQYVEHMPTKVDIPLSSSLIQECISWLKK